MQTVLIVIHLLVAIALVVCVLLQRTAQDGGGLVGGGGTMGGLFTARGSANLLTRTTAILAVIFVSMSLLLGVLAGRAHKSESLADKINPMIEKTDTSAPAPAESAPKDLAPSVPVGKQ